MPVEVDNLGSRFVKMEGLKRDSFELETPFARFLTKALEDEVYPKDPRKDPRKIKKENWEKIWGRMMNIMIIFAFGKVEGGEALGRRFTLNEIGGGIIFPSEPKPLVGERIRQLVKTGTRHLYQASDDLKQQYPNLLGRSVTEKTFMAEQSGSTRAVAAAILQGAATYQDLIDHGLSSDDIISARIVLSSYGLKVPNFSGKYQQLEADLQAVKADDPADKKQQILDGMNWFFLCNPNFKKDKPFYLTVSDLAQMANLHFSRQFSEHKLILQVLSEVGINQRLVSVEVKSGPQKGMHRINFILTVDKDRALAVLSQDPRLEPLRREVVKQICGEKVGKLPTTTQLIKSEEYKSIGSLLKQLGLKSGGPHFSIGSLLAGCPLPVFKNTRSSYHYYSVSMEQPLSEFLRNFHSH